MSDPVDSADLVKPLLARLSQLKAENERLRAALTECGLIASEIGGEYTAAAASEAIVALAESGGGE